MDVSSSLMDMSETQNANEPQFSLLAVGALYRDVIIKVPTFPAEDDKQSAVSEHTRVGGNISNTLSVLSQVIPKPSQLIYATVVGGPEAIWRPLMNALEAKDIIMLYEIRAEDGQVTPTAYIFESQSTGSRTIISHQLIPQLKTSEVLSLLFTHFLPKNTFMSNAYDDMLSRVYNAHSSFYPSWIHFEGRECFMVDGVIEHFRNRKDRGPKPCLVSVEFEKYGRPGLERLMGLCDIAFVAQGYIRDLLDAEGLDGKNKSPSSLVTQFVKSIRASMRRNSTVFVTVGAGGAYVIQYDAELNFNVTPIPAPAIPQSEILETTGAGDTFIGAVIYGIGYKKWDALTAARVAVSVASKKCLQVGYEMLGNFEKGFGSCESMDNILDGEVSERRSVGPEVKRTEGLL